MTSIGKSKLFAKLNSFASVFGSAVAVSAAVNGHRTPKAKHLNTLGIDPQDFKTIDR